MTLTVEEWSQRLLSTVVFDFDPRQLRIPRGNGRLSGRWVDDPFTTISKLLGLFDSDSKPHVPAFRPATDADKAEYKRRFKEAIPPAWTDVQVDFSDDAEVILRAKDASGKPQYRYSAERKARQDAMKWARVVQVAEHIPKLDEGLSGVQGDPTKAAARLMYLTGVRVGATDKQIGRQKAYGATTLRKNHATVNDDGTVTLSFTAKEGVPAEYVIDDDELAEFIMARLAEEGDGEDLLFETSAARTQRLLQEVTGLPGMKNHDLRTLLANRLAAAQASRMEPTEDEKELRRLQREIAKEVAAVLRNRPEQALKAYIDPSVFAPLRSPSSPGSPNTPESVSELPENRRVGDYSPQNGDALVLVGQEAYRFDGQQWVNLQNPSETISDAEMQSMLKPEEGQEPGAVALFSSNNKLPLETRQLAASAAWRAAQDEPAITAAMRELSDAFGMELEGLRYRLKKSDRIAEKIVGDAREYAQRTGTDPEAAYEMMAARLSDSVRFTMLSNLTDLRADYQRVISGLEEAGWTARVKDYFARPLEETGGYRGVNAALTSPDGMNVELQFHTPESFRIKNLNHPEYEVRRQPDATAEERAQALQVMFLRMYLSQTLPEGYEDVSNPAALGLTAEEIDRLRPLLGL